MILLKIAKSSKKKNDRAPKDAWMAWDADKKCWYASEVISNARPWASEERARAVLKVSLPNYVVVEVTPTRRSHY